MSDDSLSLRSVTVERKHSTFSPASCSFTFFLLLAPQQSLVGRMRRYRAIMANPVPSSSNLLSRTSDCYIFVHHNTSQTHERLARASAPLLRFSVPLSEINSVNSSSDCKNSETAINFLHTCVIRSCSRAHMPTPRHTDPRRRSGMDRLSN